MKSILFAVSLLCLLVGSPAIAASQSSSNIPSTAQSAAAINQFSGQVHEALIAGDYEKATNIMKKAAANGIQAAKVMLSMAYFSGTGVEQDKAKALAMMEAAQDTAQQAASEAAQQAANQMKAGMSAAQQKAAEALYKAFQENGTIEEQPSK